MRCAVIEDNVVVNVIEIDPKQIDDMNDLVIVASDDAGPGWSYVDGKLSPAATKETPADFPLLPWQFKALVDYLGKDAEIRAAIAALPAGLGRSAALSRYQNASSYRYDDPLLQQIRQAIKMPVETLSAAWMQAKDLTSS